MKTLLVLATILPLTLVAQKKVSKNKSAVRTEEPGKLTKQEKFEPISLFFVMLTKGPERNQDSLTAARIQEGHMANITKLSKNGKLLLAGPFMEDVNWRGIFILKCDTQEEAEALVKTDPAVAAGRLSYEIHPWLTGKNCLFK